MHIWNINIAKKKKEYKTNLIETNTAETYIVQRFYVHTNINNTSLSFKYL